MLLLFGWTTRTKALTSGLFYCRNERSERKYDLLEARRWFTLFFLPVIPLRILGNLVQCSSCGVQYDQRSLEEPAQTWQSPEDVVRAALLDIGTENLDRIVATAFDLGLSPAHLRGILLEKVTLAEAEEAINRNLIG